jgi:hypothetical protein
MHFLPQLPLLLNKVLARGLDFIPYTIIREQTNCLFFYSNTHECIVYTTFMYACKLLSGPSEENSSNSSTNKGPELLLRSANHMTMSTITGDNVLLPGMCQSADTAMVLNFYCAA